MGTTKELVAIVDYGTGNVHSVGRMLTSLGVQWVHTRESQILRSATHLMMPGVGHCSQAMRSLNETGTGEILRSLVFDSRIPVLGICLGMQLMTRSSEEGSTRCLGWFDADTVRIRPADCKTFKVPNIGWHAVRRVSPLAKAFSGIDVGSQPFYFCHAYGVRAEDLADVSANFDYEVPYVAALERGNILGVQFHPEKSQEVGAALIGNFLSMGAQNV